VLSRVIAAFEIGTSELFSINFPVTGVLCCAYSDLQQQSTANTMASLIANCRLIKKKGVVIAVQTAKKRTIVLILATKSK
jgi:hypothetical protein